MKYKISGVKNLSVAPLTMYHAYTETITATRKKLFIAAKSTERRVNIQLNEID